MNSPAQADGLRLSRHFRVLAVITWILVAFGALVRAKKAGLSCPDWPLCLGEVVPDVKVPGVVYEFGHRALAGAVSLVFAAGAWRVWKVPSLRTIAKPWLVGGAVLLLTQIVFGGLTVLIVHKGSGDPRPETWPVATHLILGNSFAALCLALSDRLASNAQPLPRRNWSPTASALARLWMVSLFAQFVLGGLIAGNIAGLVCTEFPACNGGVWFPAWTGLVGVQILHRLNAYVLFVSAWALWQTTRNRAHNQLIFALALLVTLQGVLGAVNIYSAIHTHVTTAHSAVAALLFSLTALLALRWHRSEAAQTSAGPTR